jgi:hypothetical protein
MIFLFPLAALVVVIVVRVRDARLAAAPDLMLREPAPWAPTRVRVLPDRARAVRTLALAEARRLTLHPTIAIGFALGLLFTGVGSFGNEDGYNRYIELTGGGGSGLYLPPLVFFAAGLCASRARRSRASDVFDATAATPFDRTLAQCLAALGPALTAFALVLLSLAVYTVVGAELPATPTVWELLALPLSVLGAGTLGVMVSRWLPFRGAPLLVLVGIASVSIALGEDYPMLISYTEFPDWQPDETYVMVANPVVAHALYLLGLDVMAAIGALLAHRTRLRLLLWLGAVATAATVAAGWATT